MKHIKMKILLVAIIISIAHSLLSSQTGTYRNPVVAGEFPDPTVIHVGDTYYSAGTSSEWEPAYRLYESKDLVNWTYLGPLFKDKPQWTVGSYWAPELFYHRGTYFVYYSARRASDRRSYIGVATTQDIREGFTDHGLIIEWTTEAIDAFVIELDGKLYITWKAYGLDDGRTIEILGSELSPDGLRLQGEPFSLLTAHTTGWEDGGAEGQCLIKHGDYIYMFYSGNACCGRGCNYMMGVARAPSIRGPWERYSGNPILHGGGQWICPGHGTIVKTKEDRYFFMYHAYNAATSVYTGRQGLMDEIVWDATTGWPRFKYGKIPSIQASAPYSTTIQHEVTDFHDTFNQPHLNIEWMWDASQQKPTHRISGGKLFVTGNNSPQVTFFGLRPRKEKYTLEVKIEKSATTAGISIYGDSDNMMGLSIIGETIELWEFRDGRRSTIATHNIPDYETITLFVETNFGQYLQFGFVSAQGQRQSIGNLQHIRHLPRWDRPPMIGIHAKGIQETIFQEVKLIY
jgi:beta-xylosidase